MPADTIYPEDRPLVYFFVTSQLLGLGGWIAILLTCIFSSRVKRQPAWYGFNIAWIFSSGSYSFLMLTGQQFKTKPIFVICLLQSAAIYAAPAIAAFTTLSLVLQLLFAFKGMLRHTSSGERILRTVLLCAIPYIISAGIYAMGMVLGFKNKDKVVLSHRGLYCAVDTGLPGVVVSILVFVVMLPTLGLEAWIIFLVRRNRATLRTLGSQSRQSVAMVFRVAMFSLFAMLAIIVSMITLFNYSIPLPDVFIGLLPSVTCIVFGTQPDIIQVWTFWRTPLPTSSMNYSRDNNQSHVDTPASRVNTVSYREEVIDFVMVEPPPLSPRLKPTHMPMPVPMSMPTLVYTNHPYSSHPYGASSGSEEKGGDLGDDDVPF